MKQAHLCCCLSGILTRLEADLDEDDGVTLEIEADIQLILSVLCESDMHRKVKRQLRPAMQFKVAADKM